MKNEKTYYRKIKTYECFGCKRNELKKKDFKLKTIEGSKVYICLKCGFYNSPYIFKQKTKTKI